MENKINIAELLRDCPNGMELDCTMFDNAKFIGVENYDKPICIRIGNGDLYFHLTKFGTWNFDDNAKCLIYPKGKTTWEGFVPPYQFKDGDIVATNSELQVFILQRAQSNTKGYCYIGYDFEFNEFFDAGVWEFERLATEEEKAKLFQAIKDNGYKWNDETKTLEKLVEPKFKVGDRVKHISSYVSGIIVKVGNKGYYIDCPKDESVRYISFTLEKDYELVPNKFDIATLKPFDKVLVRDGNKDKWNIDFFGYYRDSDDYQCMTFVKNQCIPYEVNQHLLGTTNDCDDFYKTWEK